MRLIWSKLAKQELDSIRRFSIERWGRDVARRYFEDLHDAARSAAVDPRRARPLRGNLHIVRVRTHYLIVKIDPASDQVTVARVLHSEMDIERHLQ